MLAPLKHRKKPPPPTARATPFRRRLDASTQLMLQRKLTIGAVNDPLEKEADAVADRVMREPSASPAISGAHGEQISRSCSACQEEEEETLRAKPQPTGLAEPKPQCTSQLDTARRHGASRFNANFEHTDTLARAFTDGSNMFFAARHFQPKQAHEPTHTPQQTVRRQAAPPSATQSSSGWAGASAGRRASGPPSASDASTALEDDVDEDVGLLEAANRRLESRIQRARRIGGRDLDANVRAFMEPRFGQRLANVRVHTGDQAESLSSSLSARAFTVGNDVFFARGEYDPSSPSGMWLLAHELTHTLQQGREGPTIQRKGGSIWKTEKLRLWLDERRGGTLGDDRARAIVNRWTEQSDEEFLNLTLSERAYLVGQLAARIVGARDERAILALLEDNVPSGEVWEMLKDVDQERLVKRFGDKKPFRQRNDEDAKTNRERLEDAIHAGEQSREAGDPDLVETNCTLDETEKATISEGYSDVLAAINAARVELEAARSDGASESNKALMSLRVVMGVRGTPSPDVLDKMAKNLRLLYDVSSTQMTIVCETKESSDECDRGGRAYVSEDEPYEIHLCQKSPDALGDSWADIDVRDVTRGLVNTFVHEFTHKINYKINDGAVREDGLPVFPDIYSHKDTFWLVSQMPGGHQFNNPDHMALFVLAAAGMASEEQVAEKMKDPRAEPAENLQVRMTKVPKVLEAALRPIGNRARLWVQQAHEDLELVLGEEPQKSGAKARRKNTKDLLDKDDWGSTAKEVNALLSIIEPIHTVFKHDFILETKKFLDEQAKADDMLNRGGVLLTPGLEAVGDKLVKGGADAPDLSDFGELTQQVETSLLDWMRDAIERSGGKKSDEELRRVIEFLRKNFENNALLGDWPGL
jgi:hypothetical protein